MNNLKEYIIEKFKINKDIELVNDDTIVDDDLLNIINKVMKDNKKKLGLFTKYIVSPTNDGRFRIQFNKKVDHDIMSKFTNLMKEEFYKIFDKNEYKFHIVLGTDLGSNDSSIIIGIGKI